MKQIIYPVMFVLLASAAFLVLAMTTVGIYGGHRVSANRVAERAEYQDCTPGISASDIKNLADRLTAVDDGVADLTGYISGRMMGNKYRVLLDREFSSSEELGKVLTKVDAKILYKTLRSYERCPSN